MPRRILVLGAAAVLLACLVGYLRRPQKPNFLLITLDTTRADRLTCYGYSAGNTPVLDALATQGVLCERAFTVAPITLAAHTTMFTGFYPAENGVVTNGRGRLDDSIPTLAEVLKREGYDTGAFVASFVLNGKFGLKRGFRTYDDDFANEEVGSDSLHRQRQGASVVDAALKWLGVKREKPFFCWVHLYDPHFPYLPHTDLFQDEYVDRPYDAEIAYVDMQVGRLVDFLKTRGLESQTLVAVVGDHGEGLGEHVEREHGMTLYNDALQVPLIFRHVGKLPAGQRVDGNVSLVDLSPTVLDLLDLRDPRTITGKSLKKVLEGREQASGLVYGATDVPFLINEWSPLRCLIEGQWKYIRTTKPELYNLAADPHERQNLLDADPATAGRMESLIVDFESRLVPREAIAVQLTARECSVLEGLGYLVGRKAGPKIVPKGPAPANLPDVKDMLPFDIEVEDAMKLAHGGSVKEAMQKLREVIAKAPTHTDAYWNLAGALREARDFGEAEKVLRGLLDVRPDSSQGHSGLAVVLMQQGKAADAIAEFKTTIELDPNNAEAHYTLARLLLSAGETESALAHFDAALEVDPQHVAAYLSRADLLTRLERTAEAIADYQMALKFESETAETHQKLGVLLADSGNSSEGGRHLARAVDLQPRNAEMQCILGVFLLQHRQYDEAIRHLAQAMELKPGYAAAIEALEEARKARAANLAAPHR